MVYCDRSGESSSEKDCVDNSGSLMFQGIHVAESEEFSSVDFHKIRLVLCQLIGQFYSGVISCETSKCLIVLTGSFVV